RSTTMLGVHRSVARIRRTASLTAWLGVVLAAASKASRNAINAPPRVARNAIATVWTSDDQIDDLRHSNSRFGGSIWFTRSTTKWKSRMKRSGLTDMKER